MPKAGNSNTDERCALLTRWQQTFPTRRVASLLADRKFVGRDWIRYLLTHRLPFRLRLKANVQLTGTRGTDPLLPAFQDRRVELESQAVLGGRFSTLSML
ncbi:hypothetical protein [Thiocystis minor]|uniref:hypothetical protein n=1 Tax=Thiocystis minor TaxID=61597 RepID=UPI00191448B6|nr:hypothetical protein [Thiocystis minor]